MARVKKYLEYPENVIDAVRKLCLKDESFEATNNEVLRAINNVGTHGLTPREKLVISMRFEKKIPTGDVAKEIKRSNQCVHTIENKALFKIKRSVRYNRRKIETSGRLYDFEGYYAHLDTQFLNAICAINSLIINDITPDEMKDSLRFAVRQLECQRAISKGFYEKDLPHHALFKNELERMKNEENNSGKDKEDDS